MTTRRTLILKWADQRSEGLIEAVRPIQAKRKHNLKKIHIVCRALVDRRKMIFPTAAEVAESGTAATFGFESFPSRQTIYNDYGEILTVWRKAFRDIENIEAAPSTSDDELLNWDASDLDAGSLENIKHLKRLVRELRQQNFGLKELITDHVPVYGDHLGPNHGSFIEDLAHWIETVHLDGFEVQEFGLTVTSRSLPGTIIMDHMIWDGLKQMVDTHHFVQKSKQLRGDDGDPELV